MATKTMISERLQTVFSPEVDTKQVVKVLIAFPEYLNVAYKMDTSEHIKDLMNHLDFFEFHFRRHLLGSPRTLHRVYSDVRSMLACDAGRAPFCIERSISHVRETLLHHEFYELMPRFDKAVANIRRQFLSNGPEKPAIREPEERI